MLIYTLLVTIFQSFVVSRSVELSNKDGISIYIIGFIFSPCLFHIFGQHKNYVGVLLGFIFYLAGVFSEIDNVGLINILSKIISIS